MVPVPEVVFHDLECGPESDDLATWEELAAAAGGPLIELGCGTGRVGLRLARERQVLGIERSPALAGAFNERAKRDGLDAQALVADAASLHLRRLFPLIIAPMQMIQQVGGSEARLGVLHVIAEHLADKGRAALAIVEDAALAELGAAEDGRRAPLPDMRELHGWVFSSRPVSVRIADHAAIVERLRESVDPRGERTEERHADRIESLDADRLEGEARVAGLTPAGRRPLPASPGYAPSTVVILEKR
jgi:precorrin-6B methylase 2